MKIAVFGKPGGGKSTLAGQIATTANLPLQQLDLLQYEKGGANFKARLLALRPGKRVYVVRRQSDVSSLLIELEQHRSSGET